jgi:hypothetical protein
LTDQHLKDLDVSPSQRLKVPQAIGELASTAPTLQILTVTEPKPWESRERR